jgi:hypothetical protein
VFHEDVGREQDLCARRPNDRSIVSRPHLSCGGGTDTRPESIDQPELAERPDGLIVCFRQ